MSLIKIKQNKLCHDPSLVVAMKGYDVINDKICKSQNKDATIDIKTMTDVYDNQMVLEPADRNEFTMNVFLNLTDYTDEYKECWKLGD